MCSLYTVYNGLCGTAVCCHSPVQLRTSAGLHQTQGRASPNPCSLVSALQYSAADQ